MKLLAGCPSPGREARARTSAGVMRPTPRAIVLSIAAVLSFFAAQHFRLLALIAVAVALGAILVVAMLEVLLGSTKSWHFERTLIPDRASVGDSVHVTLRAQPTRWWAASVLVLEAAGPTIKRMSFARSTGSSVSETSWTLPATRRGLFQAGPSELWRHDVLGLFKRLCSTVTPTSIVVHPASVTVRRKSLLSLAHLDAVYVHQQRSDERGDLRPYVSGDDPRRVSWKASARASAAGTGTGLVVSGDDWRQPDDDVRIVLELDDLPPGPGSFVVPSNANPRTSVLNPNRELALSVTASVLTALDGRLPCALEIRNAGKTLHSARSLPENLDALALVEQLDPTAPRPTGTRRVTSDSGARLARQERQPNIVISGPGGQGDAQVHFVCDTRNGVAPSRDRSTVLVHSLEWFRREYGGGS